MPRSNSVIRRYTPPTCTLEVLAQSSPLSRWLGKTVLKQLSFELRFDDPRLPEERRIPIQGDRDQLEALCDVVTSYVKEFLQQSPESFWVSFSGLKNSSSASDVNQLETASKSVKTLTSLPSSTPGEYIYLEPSSYLNHNLFLGSLANQTSGSVIQLSLLQLFDLASALDEYSADIITLPNLQSHRASLNVPMWAPVAAVLVIGVGLSPVALQYANQIRQKSPQTASKTAPSPSSNLAFSPKSEFDFPTPQPLLTPPDNLRSQPFLASTPPPANNSLPATPLISPNSAFSTDGLANNSSVKVNPSLTAGAKPGSARTVGQKNLPNSSKTNPQVTIQSTYPQNAIAPALPSNIALAPQQNFVDRSRKNISSSALPALRTLPLLNPDQISTSKLDQGYTSPVSSSKNQLVTRLRTRNKLPLAAETNTTASFDTPQLAEARKYLEKRWHPAKGFAETLEYSLTVSMDGSLEQILPLNQAATQNVDSAGIPKIGQPFVSGSKYGQNLRIRAVFSPDGKVQTFSESQ